MLNHDEKRKAIRYASIFLRNEVDDLNKTIRLATDEEIKVILKRRLRELEPDLELFEKLRDYI